MIRNGFDREADNLSDLKFHAVHGRNITLTHGGSRAVRGYPSIVGLVFSHRPISIDELVCIRQSEVQRGRFGPFSVLHFGVTSIDPSSHLPNSGILGDEALEYFEHNPCYWIAHLPKRCVSQGSIVQFSVSQRGEIKYKVNGVDKGIFIRGIDTTFPLWVVIDVYGKAKSVEFVTSREVRAHNTGIRRAQTGIVAAAAHPPRQIQFQVTPLSIAALHPPRDIQQQTLRFIDAQYPPREIQQQSTPWAYRILAVVYGWTWFRACPEIGAPEGDGAKWLLAAVIFFWAWFRASRARSWINRLLAAVFGWTWYRACPENETPGSDKIKWLLAALVFFWAWFRAKSVKSTPPPAELTSSTHVPAQQPSGVPAADSASSCSICWAASADFAVYPCGHQCMCNGCAVIIKRSGDRCPICRRSITDILKIFKS